MNTCDEVRVSDLPANSIGTNELDLAFQAIREATPAEVRDKIERFEMACKAMPQVELEVKHYFANGLYVRELFIPAGTTGTGAVHLHEHVSMIISGDITVMSEHGNQRIKAPMIRVMKPGTKHVAFAHEDTVWVTAHATDATTVEEAEARLVVANYEGLPYTGQHKKLKGS
jgi:hypothetical protein